MKRIRKFIKKRMKLIFAFILGTIVSGTGVLTTLAITGTSVGYTDTNNIGEVTVQGAIDKVYQIATDHECKTGYEKETTSSSSYECKEKLFLKAYIYNQTSGASNYCVTGTENTCEETTCYKTKSANSCPAGTIIKYKVNSSNNTTETFHVMYDDANTITMQSQRNTVYNTAWITDADYGSTAQNDKGPLTVLAALESATSNWTNVNNQTYTMGTTTFKTNAYTGCDATSCTVNKYTLAERTAKARMITVQEANYLGCTGTQQSCPIWMNNYLYQSTNYGGTASDNAQRNGAYNNGYWTMSVHSSETNRARLVYRIGSVSNFYVYSNDYGARAVVVVNK